MNAPAEVIPEPVYQCPTRPYYEHMVSSRNDTPSYPQHVESDRRFGLLEPGGSNLTSHCRPRRWTRKRVQVQR